MLIILLQKCSMGTIAKDKRQITLYYSSKTSIGKQLDAYVNASEKKVLSIDISKTDVTGTHWVEIAEGLGVQVSDLIGNDHPDFKEKYGDGKIDLEANDWLKVLENNPELLKSPIAINGEDYQWLETSAAFKKYMEHDSSGINNHQ